MMIPSMSPNNNLQEIINRAEMMLDSLVRSNQMHITFAQHTLNLFKQNIETVYRAILQHQDINGNIQPNIVDQVITGSLTQCGQYVQAQINNQANSGMMNNNNNNMMFGGMNTGNGNSMFANSGGGYRSIFTDNNNNGNPGAFMAPNNGSRHPYGFGATGTQSATSVYGNRQPNDVRNQILSLANNAVMPTNNNNDFNNNNNNNTNNSNNNSNPVMDPSELMASAKPSIPRIQSLDVTNRIVPTLELPTDKMKCVKVQQFKGTEIDDFNAYTINYPFLVTNTDTFIADIRNNVLPIVTPQSEYFNVKKPYFISIEHTVPVVMKVTNSEFNKIYESMVNNKDMNDGKLREPLRIIGTIAHSYYNVINNTLCRYFNDVLKYYLRHSNMRVVINKIDQIDSALLAPCDDIKWLQSHDKFGSRSIKLLGNVLRSLFYNNSMCDITDIAGLREMMSIPQIVVHTNGFSSNNHVHHTDNEIISNAELLSKLSEYTVIRKKKTSIITNLDFIYGKPDSSDVYVKKQFENETDCVLGEYIPIDDTTDTTLYVINDGTDAISKYTIGYDLDNHITAGQ